MYGYVLIRYRMTNKIAKEIRVHMNDYRCFEIISELCACVVLNGVCFSGTGPPSIQILSTARVLYAGVLRPATRLSMF